MKRLYKYFIALLAFAGILESYSAFAQPAPKGDLSVAINYYVNNNTVPSLLVRVKTKVDGRFQPVAGITLKLFLDKDSAGTSIGSVTTNRKGEGRIYIPVTVKKQWATSVKHTFLATFKGDKKYEEAKADLTVSRAKILLNTTDKTITATVLEMKDTTWVPVKGVELKIAVKRLTGDLPVNETPAFTTDSTGNVSADFKRDSIPGGKSGSIVLIAKIEDNDQYGNISVEKTVSWGAKFIPVNTFNKRTLFATRDKAPIWLQLIAYSILIAVWGILIFLVFNLFKIKKIGSRLE
ncbi:hypothetical protein KXD93_12840 [Mucilaginibacter sp. BJC16-A38]|uniref:hypothetical protein n=1 Tax=Mucilaginibacter phenanthrenivorans TaxID=1234842 RepID=UPI002157A02F|nr:hypothetical protein [Mucilaginibacter phenanthrenivorans]MCR8558535.1 hypothetical protein [Mucilaginibacter phenanthrenivorans]